MTDWTGLLADWQAERARTKSALDNKVGRGSNPVLMFRARIMLKQADSLARLVDAFWNERCLATSYDPGDKTKSRKLTKATRILENLIAEIEGEQDEHKK